jgi:hypothetical protein
LIIGGTLVCVLIIAIILVPILIWLRRIRIWDQLEDLSYELVVPQIELEYSRLVSRLPLIHQYLEERSIHVFELASWRAFRATGVAIISEC